MNANNDFSVGAFARDVAVGAGLGFVAGVVPAYAPMLFGAATSSSGASAVASLAANSVASVAGNAVSRYNNNLNPFDLIQTPAFAALGYTAGGMALLTELSAAGSGLSNFSVAMLSQIVGTHATYGPALLFEASNAQVGSYDSYSPSDVNALDVVFDAYCGTKCY